MNLRHLEHLLAVIDTGSFSRAAEQHHITQSALSRSIQALEVIKLLLGLGEGLVGRILSVDTTDMSFRTFNLRPDPANEVTYANRDRIIVQELEGLCAPGLAH